MRIAFLTFFLFLLLIAPATNLFITPVFAQTGTPSAAFSIGSSRLDPASPLYFLKPIREAIEIKLAGTEKVRVLRRLEFAERRIREMNSLTAGRREDLIAPNVEKFLYEIGSIGLIKDTSLHATISSNLGHYMESLVALYGNLTDEASKRAIRSAIFRSMEINLHYFTDRGPILSNKLFSPQGTKFELGCNLLTKEASSSAINESERQILMERGSRCSGIVWKLSTWQ